ncbi:MAG TPA: hypothetical protein VIM34_11305 [Burkholderiaceae bacterium]
MHEAMTVAGEQSAEVVTKVTIWLDSLHCAGFLERARDLGNAAAFGPRDLAMTNGQPKR